MGFQSSPDKHVGLIIPRRSVRFCWPRSSRGAMDDGGAVEPLPTRFYQDPVVPAGPARGLRF